MKKTLMSAAGLSLLSSATLLAESGGSMSESGGLFALAAAFAIGIAAFGAARGQGNAAGKALEGIARNPSAADKIFTPMILGLVFMEFQALLGFVIAFLILNS